MSARLQVPLSQRRHTNIAAVRYTKNGVKLEIACYKNKVISYRSGVETRLDEVLQVERVFTNISRGLYASEKEIQTVFGSGTTEREALEYILQNGELQVAQQERTAEVDQMFIDIAVIISQKCVNAVTQKPFPAQVIEQALRSIGARIKLDQPVKKQALALMHQLIDAQLIPITRARMKLRCIAPDTASLAKLVDWCVSNEATIVEETTNTIEQENGNGSGSAISGKQPSLLILIPPHLFREIEKFVKSELPPGGTVHMVESAAMQLGDGDLMMDADLIAQANTHVSSTCTTTAGNENSSSHHTAGGGSSSNNNNNNNINTINNNNTPHSDGNRGGKRGKKGGGGKKQHGGKHHRHHNNTDDDNDDNNNNQEDDDIEDDDDDDKNKNRKTSAKTNLASTPALNDGEDSDSLEAALHKLGLDEKCGSDDDDTDAKSKRGKKKTKRRNAGQQQQQQSTKTQKEVKFDVPEDSDDEVLVNRKQRKQAVAAAKAKEDETHQNWDDEYEYNYEYMEEDEEDHAH